MKLEVGMYVRTDEGIAKVIEKRKNPYGEETIFIIDKPFMYHLTDFLGTAEDMIDVNFEEDTKQIKGASHNIIDLIEVGDFITLGENNYPLQIRNKWEHGGDIHIELSNGAKFEDLHYNNEFKIYSIVTKEQFDAMAYKLDSK